MAQLLARHSDINLTMNTYTHVEVRDQAMAVGSLPAPPSQLPVVDEIIEMRATGTDDRLALELAQETVVRGQRLSATGVSDDASVANTLCPKLLPMKPLDTSCHEGNTGDSSPAPLAQLAEQLTLNRHSDHVFLPRIAVS